MADINKNIDKVTAWTEGLDSVRDSINLKEKNLNDILNEADYNILPTALKDESLEDKIEWLMINLPKDKKAKLKSSIESSQVEDDKQQKVDNYNLIADKSEKIFSKMQDDIESLEQIYLSEKYKNEILFNKINNDPDKIRMEELEKEDNKISLQIKECQDELDVINLDLEDDNIRSKKLLTSRKKELEEKLKELGIKKDDINKELFPLQKKFANILKECRDKNKALLKVKNTLDDSKKLYKNALLKYNDDITKTADVLSQNGIKVDNKTIDLKERTEEKPKVAPEEKLEVAPEEKLEVAPEEKLEVVPEEKLEVVPEEKLEVDQKEKLEVDQKEKQKVDSKEKPKAEEFAYEQKIDNSPKKGIQTEDGTIQYEQVPTQPIVEQKEEALVKPISPTKSNLDVINGYAAKARALSKNERKVLLSDELLGNNYSKVIDAYQNIEKKDITQEDKDKLKENILTDYNIITSDVEKLDNKDIKKIFEMCDDEVKPLNEKSFIACLKGDFIDVNSKDINKFGEVISEYYNLKRENKLDPETDKFMEKNLINPCKMTFLKREAENIYSNPIMLKINRGELGFGLFTGEVSKKNKAISKIMNETIKNSELEIIDKSNILKTADEPIVENKTELKKQLEIVEKSVTNNINAKKVDELDNNPFELFKSSLQQDVYPPSDVKSRDKSINIPVEGKGKY